MKIYRLYEVKGYAGDSYYCIPNENTIQYYTKRELAELHPKYQEYKRLETEEEKRLLSLNDEEIVDEDDQWFDHEPNYVAIQEIDVITEEQFILNKLAGE